MDENLILLVDYENICRLCLQSTGVMSDIFENDGENSIQNLIFRCTNLQMHENDGLPTIICHKCRYVVELSCDFQDLVRRTHFLLLESNKTELSKQLEESDSAVKHNEKDPPDCITIEDDITLEIIKVKDEQEMPENVVPKQVTITKTGERTRKAPPKHLTCQICLTAFSTTEDVNMHVLEHYDGSNLTPYLKLQRPYSCEACHAGPVSKTEVVRHHRRHLGVNPYECRHPGCGFVGKNLESFRHHGIKHGAFSHICEQCGAAFRRRWELVAHKTRAHAASPRRCKICRRICKNQITYNAHMQTHIRPPKFVCTAAGCARRYRSLSALTAHGRAHRGERCFTCHLCVAAYTSQSLLNRHLRMHERPRLSKCDKCPMTFEEYGAFYRHRVAAHGRWQPHRCTHCHQGYQTEAKLATHMQQCKLASQTKENADAFGAVIVTDTNNTNGAKHTNDANCANLVNNVMNANSVNDTNSESYANGVKDASDANSANIVNVASEPLVHLDNAREIHISSIHEIIGADSKILQLDSHILKGQSLLVQAGDVTDLNRDTLVLQELPSDGLLYIEVDPDSEDDLGQPWH